MAPTLLVLATSNSHKASELQSMLDTAGLDYHVVTLADIGFHEPIEETGSTFEENAFIKASTVHRFTGLTVLADDSGLEVSALDGRPGVRSARFAGEQATDADNRARLRTELSQLGIEASPARFRCVLCVIDGMRTVLTEGTSNGSVIVEERGAHGFGYDAMFVPHGHTLTYGELTPSEKLATSHRGVAMRSMIDQLKGASHLNDAIDPTVARQLLIDVACATMLPSPATLTTMIANVPRSMHLELYEILLQSYLFGGFPAALDALTVCYRIHGAPPVAGEIGTTLTSHEVRTRGEALCRDIYGHVYDKMIDTLSSVSPDLADWMITEGYGKTLSRSGSSAVTRELCIVAMLTVLGRQQQLVSHVRGSLRVGATIDDLIAIEHSITEQLGTQVSKRLSDLILLQEGRLANQ